MKPGKVFIKVSKNTKVRRYNFDNGEVRFTDSDNRLLAWFRNGKFVWLKSGVTA